MPQSFDKSQPSKAEADDVEELVEYLARSTSLERATARRVVDDVFAFLVEEPEAFVRRRHLELQRQGLSNTAIFMRLKVELTRRRFRAPDFTERQLRRLIYG